MSIVQSQQNLSIHENEQFYSIKECSKRKYTKVETVYYMYKYYINFYNILTHVHKTLIIKKKIEEGWYINGPRVRKGN